MNTFYKIKEGMDEEHKKYLSELRLAYSQAEEELNRQQGITQKRLDDITQKLSLAIKELELTRENNLTLLLANQKLKDENKAIEQEKAQFYADKEAEEQKRKEWDDKVKFDIARISELERQSNLTLSEREKSAKEKEDAADYACSKNELVLADIKSKKEELSIIANDIEVAKADLALKQEQYGKDKAQLDFEIKYNQTQNQEILSRRNSLYDYEVSIKGREQSVDLRESQVKIREDNVSDRELAADLREIELNRKQERAEGLMAIYEEKVKNVKTV